MLQRLQEKTSSRFLLHALQDMDRAIIHHTNWLKGLHGVLICSDRPPELSDLVHDAHCRCNFGKWYYSDGQQELGGIDTFENIGVFHQEMHDAARKLLEESQSDTPISSDEYETFMDKAIEFKLEVRRLQQEIISEVCLVDHLTGAWNRQAMSLQLVQEYERVRRTGNSAVLCMMDLDHFKQINDEYGHGIGDRALQQMVDFCQTELRIYDSIFRYGGEEFLICLPDTSIEEAEALINRLRAKLQDEELNVTEDVSITVTASFGLSVMSPRKSLDDIITESDHALLCAKAEGRNKVCVWDI